MGQVRRQGWRAQDALLPSLTVAACIPADSGWGYMLSRDLAELISNTAITYTAMPERYVGRVCGR